MSCQSSVWMWDIDTCMSDDGDLHWACMKTLAYDRMSTGQFWARGTYRGGHEVLANRHAGRFTQPSCMAIFKERREEMYR